MSWFSLDELSFRAKVQRVRVQRFWALGSEVQKFGVQRLWVHANIETETCLTHRSSYFELLVQFATAIYPVCHMIIKVISYRVVPEIHLA